MWATPSMPVKGERARGLGWFRCDGSRKCPGGRGGGGGVGVRGGGDFSDVAGVGGLGGGWGLEAFAGHFFFEVEVAAALAVGGFAEGALFPPGEAVHALGGDLGEDAVDALLLGEFLLLALLGLADHALVELP